MSHTAQVVLGVVIIAVAGLYPMVAVYRLNKRLGRPEGPDARELALWLAFTLSFPFALALTGAGLIAARLGHSPLYRSVVGGLWGFALIAGGVYLLNKR